MERLTLPIGISFPKTALEVSVEFDAHLKTASIANHLPIPTGFAELDEHLGGGLHPESLLLAGGPPGVGKTIFVLQAARNIAAAGEAVACVVCFEHSEVYLYHRLLCLESFLRANGHEPITLGAIRDAIANASDVGLQTLLDALPAARPAWEGIVSYWERFCLIKGHPMKTSLNVLDIYLSHLRARGERVVLFVDYLQKVPVISPGHELGAEKQIRIVTEGLKNLAMAHGVPIVAVAASDAVGLKNEQVRFQDLWGGSSVQYEPDVALMLNVAVGNHANGDQQNETIVFSIKKNRLGPANVQIAHQLLGQHFAFLPKGRNCDTFERAKTIDRLSN